jgi:hypothetical protein
MVDTRQIHLGTFSAWLRGVFNSDPRQWSARTFPPSFTNGRRSKWNAMIGREIVGNAALHRSIICMNDRPGQGCSARQESDEEH